MQDVIRKNIIEDLGLDKLPQKDQEEMLLMIGRLIFQGVIIRVMSLLSEKDKDDFDKLLSEKIEDEEAVLKFLESRVPNLNEIINDEVASFKQESGEFMKNLKNR